MGNSQDDARQRTRLPPLSRFTPSLLAGLRAGTGVPDAESYRDGVIATRRLRRPLRAWPLP